MNKLTTTLSNMITSHLRTLGVAFMLIGTLALNGQSQKASLDFGITEIANFEQRTYFLYSLLNDSRFDVAVGEQDGVFVVSLDAAFEGSGLNETFADFKSQNERLFAQMSKEEAAETALQYKALLPLEFANQMMSVVYRQSRDNSHCADAYPFCTDNGMYEFPAGVDQPSAESGPYYDCLSTQPNPAWYFMRMDNPGNMNIHMYSTPSVDIDFCCWGPYDNPLEACNNLTQSMVVSCSYSTSWTENCLIPATAQNGDYFILIITNYSNSPCDIHFSKESGTGTTDCNILPPLVNNDGPYCEGETISLTAQGQSGATYSWTGPNNFNSNQQNPVIQNCTPSMSGTYTCTITLDAQSNNSTTEVLVYPNPNAEFSFDNVCQGQAIEFTCLSENDSYSWDFDDGQTATEASVSHTYAQAGTYHVTLTVTSGHGRCTAQKTHDVTVYAQPNAQATAQPVSVQYNGTSTLTANAGATGNFTYHWSPENMVVDPNSPTTQTVGLVANQQYTLTITNPEGGCTSTAYVTVSMDGSDMTATAVADDYELCQDEWTTLRAIPAAGTGTYTYSWSENGPDSFTSTQQNPSVQPSVGTHIYTCHVSDGIVDQYPTVTVVVHPKKIHDIYDTICNNQYFTFFDGSHLTVTDVYPYHFSTQFGCDSLVNLHLQVNSTKTDEIELSGCDSVTCDWFGQTLSFDTNGDNVLWGHTEQNCEWKRTVHVRDMKYTPNPVSIRCGDDFYLADGDVVAVITETEFFSFNYVFTVEEVGRSLWDECIWSINKDSWRIDQSMNSNRRESTCTVYVADRDEELVELNCKVRNSCMNVGEYKTFSIFLKSSYVGVDEYDDNNAGVSILPNPNNGQMHINFEQMEGRVNVKVFDMKGNRIDAFETIVGPGSSSYDYTMSTRAQGIYFFVISDSHRSITRKVVIIQ